MRDREKENREYNEFLELFHERYGTEQETAQSTPATSQLQQAEQNEPQEKSVGIPVLKESAADSEKGRTNALQHSGEQAVHSRKPFKKTNRQRQIIGLVCVVLAVIIAAAILITRLGGIGTDALKGTWDLDGVTVYQFDGKGAGSLNLPSNSYAFTYEIKDGTLAIDFESEAARDKTYTFTTDKNKLTLTDSEGEVKTFELTKRQN